MGYNTTVVILNDYLQEIENDPHFGKNLVRAIRKVSVYGHPVDVSAQDERSLCCNAARVIEAHHADHYVCVKIGGNSGEIIPVRTDQE